MINKQTILKHFQTDKEKMDFSKIYDKVIICTKNKIPTHSDFLDPAKCEDFTSIFKKYFSDDLDVELYGGHSDFERGIIGFYPKNYYDDSTLKEEFPISAIKIAHNSKFSKTPLHKDYLGSVIGLGLTREVIGDILIQEDFAILFCQTNILSYIMMNLEKIGRTSVKLEEIPNSKLCDLLPTKETVESKIIVSSLRLDVVISACFKISRSKAKSFIESERVFVNWKTVTNTSKNIELGDFITLRKAGRCKILDVVGTTKKDRIVLLIEK